MTRGSRQQFRRVAWTLVTVVVASMATSASGVGPGLGSLAAGEASHGQVVADPSDTLQVEALPSAAQRSVVQASMGPSSMAPSLEAGPSSGAGSAGSAGSSAVPGQR